MNILVVDDEYYIVKNIIETTDWSALGIEQAFPAYSASQAKRIFEGSQDIDILLTDIEMPRETGLQLVEWLHENDFHPIVLVLTGHQRFDYAQEALNLHIFSYLLKPIDPDQLMEKLAAAYGYPYVRACCNRELGEVGEKTLASTPRDTAMVVMRLARMK